MFDFYGEIRPFDFLRSMAYRLLWLGAFTLGYPFIHTTILRATGCGTQTCGAVGLVAAMVIKPTVVTLVLLSLPAPLMGRSRDAGLPAWLGLVPLIFAAPGVAALVVAGAPWAMSFSLGLIGPRPIPWHLLFPIWLFVVLGALPTHPRRDWKARSFAPLELATAAALAYLAAALILSSSFGTPLGRLFLSVPWLLKIVFFPVFWLRFAVVAATALILWSKWHEEVTATTSSGPATPPPSSGSPAFGRRTTSDPAVFGQRRSLADADPEDATPENTAPRIPVLTIAAVAIAAAVIQWFAVTSGQLAPLRFAIDISPVIVPTAALDALLIAALWLVVATRTKWSVILLLVAVTPFGLWVRERVVDHRARVAQTAEIAAIPVTPLTARPTTLVIRAPSFVDSEIVTTSATAGGFSTILVEHSGNTYRDVTPRRPGAAGRLRSVDEKATPPAEYLRLLIGPESSFARPRANVPSNWGPFELRYHTPTRDDLVAVTYDRLGRQRALVPLLGISGWQLESADEFRKSRGELSAELIRRAVAGLPPDR